MCLRSAAWHCGATSQTTRRTELEGSMCRRGAVVWPGVGRSVTQKTLGHAPAMWTWTDHRVLYLSPRSPPPRALRSVSGCASKLIMDTLGIEPRAPRMLSGCDATTPRAHDTRECHQA